MILAFTILFPILAALLVVCFRRTERTPLLILSIVLQFLASALLVATALFPEETLSLFHISDKVEIAFRSDAIARLFCTLTAVVYPFILLCSSVLMKREKSEPRFYACMFLSEAAIVGTILSSGLITMYVCYELLTLSIVPLIFHHRTYESSRAEKKYLLYTVASALMVLFGIIVLLNNATTLTFTVGGVGLKISPLSLWALFCMTLGFGSRTGLYPLHGRLMTTLTVAPSPENALLSGLITTAGVLAIIRSLYFIADPAQIKGTWVQTALLTLALVSTLIGSVLAYGEKRLKQRSAFLTVSLSSYALVGSFLFTEGGVKSALLQIVFHSVAKTVLFLFSGAVLSLTGETETNALYGIGRRMPVITVGFTFAALSMIGLPPTGGFLSTWALATAALDGISAPLSYIIPAVLLFSALLTAGSLLSISVRAFYPGDKINPAYVNPETKKEPILLALPIVLLAVFPLLCGIPSGAISEIAESIVGTIL